MYKINEITINNAKNVPKVQPSGLDFYRAVKQKHLRDFQKKSKKDECLPGMLRT